MYAMLFPITLERGAKDQNGIGPGRLAKGVVTETRGEKKWNGAR